MEETIKKEKVILLILDGFGIGEHNKHTNAIYAANTPFFDEMDKLYSRAELYASEEYVGIKKNQFGNSELGHMTIGSGRTILGIDEIFNKLIDEHQAEQFLLEQPWVKDALEKDNVVHICGMYSSGCVHSNKKHIDYLLEFFQARNKKVALHLISDGRDTKGNVFLSDLQLLQDKLAPTSKIISLSGRFYAMDRDKNWDRTELYYQAMNQSSSSFYDGDLIDYVKEQYQSGIDDEFIKPIYKRESNYLFQPNDDLIFANYRADRIVQIIELFNNKQIKLIGLCSYPNAKLDAIIIDKQVINHTLGDLLIENNIRQLRVAETEKFAHVTYFFDAGRNISNPLQDQILINSPKVKTYNLKPEMSAEEITKTIIDNIPKYDFILANFANADMVGHTGDFEATKTAIEFLDKKCATLYNNLIGIWDGTLIITADHGNADKMLDSNNQVVKTHSIAKVPFYVLSNKYKLKSFTGKLQDVAPSILYIYNINKPKDMSGENLIEVK